MEILENNEKTTVLFTCLTESKAFRNEDQVERYSVKELSEVFFLMMLTLNLLSLTRFSIDADSYAMDSLKYPLFERVYLSGTDLGNVIGTLKHASEYLKQRDVDLPILDIKRFLRGLRPNVMSSSLKRSFFYKLQTKLKINDSYLIAFRRDIVDTNPDDLTYSEKKILGHRLYNQLRKYNYRVDLLAILQKFMDSSSE